MSGDGGPLPGRAKSEREKTKMKTKKERLDAMNLYLETTCEDMQSHRKIMCQYLREGDEVMAKGDPVKFCQQAVYRDSENALAVLRFMRVYTNEVTKKEYDAWTATIQECAASELEMIAIDARYMRDMARKINAGAAQ